MSKVTIEPIPKAHVQLSANEITALVLAAQTGRTGDTHALREAWVTGLHKLRAADEDLRRGSGQAYESLPTGGDPGDELLEVESELAPLFGGFLARFPWQAALVGAITGAATSLIFQWIGW